MPRSVLLSIPFVIIAGMRSVAAARRRPRSFAKCLVSSQLRDVQGEQVTQKGLMHVITYLTRTVPSWADACILKEMPNLTMQYMADTASIELIRNCQEEGLLRHTCRGKEVSYINEVALIECCKGTGGY